MADTDAQDGLPITSSSDQMIENWLKSLYLKYRHLEGQDDLGIQTKDFFNIITTASSVVDSLASWVSEDVLDLVTILLTHVQEKRSDVLVLPSLPTESLAYVGLGRMDKDDFAALYFEYLQAMAQEEIRWIVVPVTDGMTIQAREEDIEARARASQDTVGATEMPDAIRPSGGRGAHWGFMIIDKQRNDANWLDGALKLGRSKRHNKICIEHMWPAGRVAGKVLCGYDKVMGRECGLFTATTLKHVPQDKDDNRFKGDRGSACGPWVFAMLEYILKNPQFLTNEDGLSGTFSRAQKRLHARNLNFDSRKTRGDMQEIIRMEAEKDLAADQLPYNLTVPILKTLNKPSIKSIWRSINKFQGSTVSSPTGSAGGSSRSGGGGRGGGGGGGGRRGGGGRDSNDDDDDWPEQYKGSPHEILAEHIADDPSMSKAERLEYAVVTLRSTQDNVFRPYPASTCGILTKKRELRFLDGFSKDNPPDFWKIPNNEIPKWVNLYASDLFNVGGSKVKVQTHKSVLHCTFKGTFKHESEEALRVYRLDSRALSNDDCTHITSPAQIAERLDQVYVDLVVPVFASLSDREIDNWVKNLHPAAKKLVQGDDNEIDHEIARGLLHRFFQGEFEDMSDAEVNEWRKKDPNMPRHHRRSTQAARWWLEWYYYQGDAATTLPHLRDSPLHWPDLEYRSNHGSKRKRSNDDNCVGDAREGSKKQKPDSVPEAGDEAVQEAGPAEEEDPKSISWATVNHATLMKHVTDEIRNDSQIGTRHSSYTYRAILFVKHGGHFKDETAHAEKWIRDLNVFTMSYDYEARDVDVWIMEDGIIDCRPTAQLIMGRLEDKYEKSAKAAPAQVNDGLRLKSGVVVPTHPPPPPTKPRKPPSESKGDGSNNPSSRVIDGQALAAETVNFTHMPKKSVLEWVELRPETVQIPKSMRVWDMKAMLQKMFGGFDHLSDDDKAYWLKNDPLFKGKKKSSRNLMAVLKERTKRVPDSDLRGIQLHYPQSYLNGMLRRLSMTVDKSEAVAAQPPVPADRIYIMASDSEEELSEENSRTYDSSPKDATHAVAPENGPIPPPPDSKKASTCHSSATPTTNTNTTTTTNNNNNYSNNSNNNNKRKHADSTAEPAPKKPKLSPPDFLTMPQTDLLIWVNQLPNKYKNQLRKTPLQLARPGLARIWLERIFTTTFQTWVAQEPLSDESLTAIDRWRQRAGDPAGVWDTLYKNDGPGLKRFLLEELVPLTETYPLTEMGDGVDDETLAVPLGLPDYTKDEARWPVLWKK